jgi:quinoprotein glucose dehydrogenase
MHRSVLCIFALLGGIALASAAPLPPLIDPQVAIKQFQTPPGFKVDLFAAEPELINPVAFCFDEQGRIFVAESYRYRRSVYDIRDHMNMYADDIACRTVEDRAAMMRKFLGDRVDTLTNQSEEILLLEDRSGSGRADYSSVFATGFNSIIDGLGAGILAHDGYIYYTDIPNFWMMPENDPGARTSIGYGFGVHISLTGHDLHGLCLGPDGRIYFSSGDRGFHVKTREGKILDYPDTGAVLRCNPNGSDLEVFAYGVRNPQRLAFDNYGNLFTGDNNCDYGDAARLVYIVEGGDSGWRIGNQISETTPAGTWNSENLWHLAFPGQAAYIVPPVAHIAQGPAGFAHYPGTGFPASYDDHFFLCDYKGASANSGIHSFAVKPKGAGFEMVDHQQFFWGGILAVDVNFSPDGQLFAADWVAAWPQNNKGRLYRLYDTNLVHSPIVLKTKKLIGDGMTNESLPELVAFLHHPDQRVRLEAQFEMARRAQWKVGGKYMDALAEVAQHDTHQLARIHALWGLEQLGHRGLLKQLFPLLHDSDSEVRAQMAKVLGEAQCKDAVGELIQSLIDPNLRVRFFAAQSLGKLGNANAVQPLLAMLRENADRDAFLRHAGVMGLLGTADKDALVAASRDESPSVRLAIVVAMRRLHMPEVAALLHDSNSLVALEAARAINDAPINDAMPQLAALIDHPSSLEMLDWRAVNANFRLGGEQNATALAHYAAHPGAPEKARMEALHALAYWAQPAARDRITGLYRPLPPRNGKMARAALRGVLPEILGIAPAPVQVEAIHAVTNLSLTEEAPRLFELAANTIVDGTVRVASLEALDGFHYARLNDAMKIALASDNRELRREGSRLLAQVSPRDAVISIAKILDTGDWSEQQDAVAVLGKLKGRASDQLLATWLDKLLSGQAPKEITFELVQAAQAHKTPMIQSRLRKYRAMQKPGDEFKGFCETLYGGDAETGRKIFTERPTAGCITCHKIHGQGGNVGPDLAGIITRHDREYILESILFPNKQIAPGFENVVVKTKNREVYAGIVKKETPDDLLISISDEGVTTLVTVKKSNIKSRQRGLSAMPEGLGRVLSKEDVRDVVEFLATLK